MKAVLVIDLPKDCWDCHLVDEWGNCNAIKITSNKFGMDVNPYNNEKPSWCPLKPLPRKFTNEEISSSEKYTAECMRVWNYCLDEITGESNG